MKVNNTIQNKRKKRIEYKCNHDSIETEYPIAECIHCKFQECEDSIPTENFKVNDDVIDKKTRKVIKKQTRIVKEITLVHGDRYQDVIGWTF